MPRRPRARDRGQRGNTLIVAMIALTGLATLGALTISSVQGGITSTSSDSAHQIALYAAEAGVMVGMRYLNEPTYAYQSIANGGEGFGNIVRNKNGDPYELPGLPGNRVQPGQSGNIFSPGMKAWYDVHVKNNRTDPGYPNLTKYERDGRIVFTSIGYGPSGATATVEVEVEFDDPKNVFTILSWREIE